MLDEVAGGEGRICRYRRTDARMAMSEVRQYFIHDFTASSLSTVVVMPLFLGGAGFGCY